MIYKLGDNTPNPNKQKMIDLRSQGLSYGSISKLFGISRARAHQLCSGYNSDSITKLKQFILKRDNYTCQWGKACNGQWKSRRQLVIHHIDFNDKNNDPKNLITICNYCHGGFHSSKNHEKKLGGKTKIQRGNKVCRRCRQKYLCKFCTEKLDTDLKIDYNGSI